MQFVDKDMKLKLSIESVYSYWNKHVIVGQILSKGET